jgi:NAD(P)-dependent dehydrogenase (short-subunit alcohol dehydrogenase family)
MNPLSGKVAAVTGAASGLGKAMALAFASEGMHLALADVEDLSPVEEAVTAKGVKSFAMRVDVSKAAEVEAFAERTAAELKGVHLVCNNAGVAPAGPMLATTPRDWQWTVAVNVLGVAYGVTTFAPLLIEQGEGHIVNTASEAGLVTTDMLGMYCATKHAVVGMTESLYRELESTPVGVSVLCPNLVNTGIFHSERNRPYGTELSAAENATIAPLREAIAAAGTSPSEVAADVVDAVREDRFWIFTHPTTVPSALVRFEDLRAARNPTNPYR